MWVASIAEGRITTSFLRNAQGSGKGSGINLRRPSPEAAIHVPDLPCPPPDRAPRAPRARLPSGACDTHAHICGPADFFPYAAERIYTPPDSTLNDYLRLLDVLGIDRAVLVQPSVYGADNRALIEALSRSRGQGLRGVAVVRPDISADEIRAFDDAGIRGVRLNLVDHAGERNVVPADVVRTLAATIAPFDWHIEFLVNLDEAPRFADGIAGLPVDIVVGHLGYPRGGAGAWSNAASLDAFLRLFETGRCWVKLTGPYRISAAPDLPYADVTPLAHRLASVNPDRLIWGTDWPHVMCKKPMPNDGDLTDLIADWLPDAALRERVLVVNPALLYRFADGESLSGNP
jgi:2-pyrone-4,6-dicarboxylate lactonase